MKVRRLIFRSDKDLITFEDAMILFFAVYWKSVDLLAEAQMKKIGQVNLEVSFPRAVVINDLETSVFSLIAV